ncbi:MAG: hypothetical protein JWP97_371 [Labilithrix sp.]|nr:hypothetical protein [Labilithrix sp.]
MRSWLLGAVMTVLGASACAAPVDEAEPASAEAGDALRLQSAPLADRDMRLIATPAGMPKPYDQPDSTGMFDERGKCGPTAVANALLLYWDDVTPEEADAAGVHWIVGTMGRQIESYFDRFHPELGCTLQHPADGAAFLRDQTDNGHPVMMWFNTEGLSSHWVTAVGHRGTGDREVVIVMSWGSYYAIPMKKLVAAWDSVYGIHNPAVACTDKTTLLR